MRTLLMMTVLCVLAWPASAQEGPVEATDPTPKPAIIGTWIGIVDQHFSGSYPAVMEISTETEGISEYASFPCAGKLTRIRDRSGFVFEETITYTEKEPDDGGCINGYITMEVIGNEMAWTWHGAAPYEDTIALGTFYRVIDMSPPPAE